MTNAHAPSPQDMLDHPLRYILPDQVAIYRRRVVRMSLLFIGVGLAAFVIDLILSAHGLQVTDGLNSARTYRDHRGAGLVLLWYAGMFLLPLYGCYRLVTLKKQIARLAKKDFISQYPAVQQLDAARSKTFEDGLRVRSEKAGNAIMTIFKVLMALLIVSVALVVLGGVMVATFR